MTNPIQTPGCLPVVDGVQAGYTPSVITIRIGDLVRSVFLLPPSVLTYIMKFIKVTCAIIRHHQKILVTQRGPGMKMAGKWEFPGGKVEEGESEEACLEREISEELNIRIRVTQKLTPYIHHYPDFSIELIPFITEYVSGELTLREHAKFLWLLPEELKKLDWAEADVMVVEEFVEFYRTHSINRNPK